MRILSLLKNGSTDIGKKTGQRRVNNFLSLDTSIIVIFLKCSRPSGGEPSVSSSLVGLYTSFNVVPSPTIPKLYLQKETKFLVN